MHFRYDFAVEHKWQIPGVKCPVCKVTWGTRGNDYPAVDVTSLGLGPALTKPEPVSLERYIELISILAEIVPDGTILRPGTTFGPFVGTTKGSFGDVTWPDTPNPLFREEVLIKLADEGVTLPIGVPPQLRLIGKTLAVQWQELQIMPQTKIHKSLLKNAVPKPCEACGRSAVKAPKVLIIDEKTVPEDVDIFRDRDLTTYILVTDRFKTACMKMGLTDVSFDEIRTL